MFGNFNKLLKYFLVSNSLSLLIRCQRREVSSIKPMIDGKAPNYEEGIKFKYSTAAYDSFIKEGFIPPEPQYRSDKRERQFLSQVDVSKGKIKVKDYKNV